MHVHADPHVCRAWIPDTRGRRDPGTPSADLWPLFHAKTGGQVAGTDQVVGKPA